MPPISPPPQPPPLKGWVILATNTGVGKTWVGCGLVTALRMRGARVRVRKPVETGCQVSPPEPTPQNATENINRIPVDATALWQAAGQIEPLSTVCPWRFSEAVAAPQAAASEGKTLYFASDIAPHLPNPHTTNMAQDADEYWIIEGAGGVLSPLTEDSLNVELARYTTLPVLLIAPDELGTLSALFCAIEALQQRKLNLVGIVLNAGMSNDTAQPSALDNQSLLQAWLPRLMSNARLPQVFSVRNQDDLRQIANCLAHVLAPN